MQHSSPAAKRNATVFACALCMALWPVPGRTAHAPGAEFAVRWDPGEGGPATPGDALRRLGKKPSAPQVYDVRYYDIDVTGDVPAGFNAITRKRTAAGRAELMFKLRGAEPLPREPSLERWRCPLGKANERKDEVDITFVGAAETVRAYSRSCVVESADLGLEPTAVLAPRPKGCASTMTRLRAGELKVEEWRLADGSRLIEASRSGRDSRKSADAFAEQVLTPLLAAGIRPLARSKSAIGGDCTR
jgi:hypothetical protein